MRRGLLAVILVAAAVALGNGYASIRRTLTTERTEIDSAWASVDTALSQRAALVPDLVAAMQKEAPGETDAIEAVNAALTVLGRAHGARERIQANGRLDTAVARLLLATESYPRLENNKALNAIANALEDSEDHIANERRKYNDAVEHYNAGIVVFPKNLVASLAGLGKIDTYFETPGAPPSKGP
jgi:LemA protein